MTLLDKLRALLPHNRPLIPVEPVLYRPIGVVRNRVKAPQSYGWADLKSDLIFHDEIEPALKALEDFSHAIVIFHISKVPEEERRLTVPVGNEAEPPERGVLATRSQRRPNPIGFSVVRIIHRRKNVLRVLGLDAIDGTPVLDIKPYLPSYDSAPEAVLPDWAMRPE